MSDERWYMDAKLLKAAYEQYGSFIAVSEAIGGADHTTLSRWWRRHKLGNLTFGPSPKTKVNEDALKRLAKTIYGNDK